MKTLGFVALRAFLFFILTQIGWMQLTSQVGNMEHVAVFAILAVLFTVGQVLAAIPLVVISAVGLAVIDGEDDRAGCLVLLGFAIMFLFIVPLSGVAGLAAVSTSGWVTFNGVTPLGLCAIAALLAVFGASNGANKKDGESDHPARAVATSSWSGRKAKERLSYQPDELDQVLAQKPKRGLVRLGDDGELVSDD